MNKFAFKKYAVIVTVSALLVVSGCKGSKPQHLSADTTSSSSSDVGSNEQIESAFQAKRSHVQVQAHGVIEKVLPDDNQGLRHQRFIVRVNPQMNILIAYNIDIAPYIDDLKAGQPIAFDGEYIFNPKGGIVHWTHRDPQGHHPDGWIKYEGKTYQ